MNPPIYTLNTNSFRLDLANFIYAYTHYISFMLSYHTLKLWMPIAIDTVKS